MSISSGRSVKPLVAAVTELDYVCVESQYVGGEAGTSGLQSFARPCSAHIVVSKFRTASAFGPFTRSVQD